MFNVSDSDWTNSNAIWSIQWVKTPDFNRKHFAFFSIITWYTYYGFLSLWKCDLSSIYFSVKHEFLLFIEITISVNLGHYSMLTFLFLLTVVFLRSFRLWPPELGTASYISWFLQYTHVSPRRLKIKPWESPFTKVPLIYWNFPSTVQCLNVTTWSNFIKKYGIMVTSCSYSQVN